MEKKVLASASCYKQLYYLNQEFDSLPTDIKNNLKVICVSLAEKLHCIFSIGFYEDGTVYIETTSEEADYNFDEIGAKLEIKQLQKKEAEFFKSLKLWYIIYKTDKGKKIKDKLNGTT